MSSKPVQVALVSIVVALSSALGGCAGAVGGDRASVPVHVAALPTVTFPATPKGDDVGKSRGVAKLEVSAPRTVLAKTDNASAFAPFPGKYPCAR